MNFDSLSTLGWFPGMADTTGSEERPVAAGQWPEPTIPFIVDPLD